MLSKGIILNRLKNRKTNCPESPNDNFLGKLLNLVNFQKVGYYF